jgi:hypothetical protein
MAHCYQMLQLTLLLAQQLSAHLQLTQRLPQLFTQVAPQQVCLLGRSGGVLAPQGLDVLQASSLQSGVLRGKGGELLPEGLVFAVVFVPEEADVALLTLQLLLLGLVGSLRASLQRPELLFKAIAFLPDPDCFYGLLLLHSVLDDEPLILLLQKLVLEDEGVRESEGVLFLEDDLERA